MVEAVVSRVVDRLGDFLDGEVVFLQGIRDEMNLLTHELSRVQCYLKDADEKQHEDDNMIRDWVSDIIALAYDIEHILYTFRVQRKTGHFRSMSCCLFDKGEELAKQIENFKHKIIDLSGKCEQYGLQNGERSNGYVKVREELKRSTNLAVEENVVGFEDQAKELLTKLLDKDSHRSIISIFGMSGQGKTALARKLYHENVVRETFGCFGWVCVSEDTIQDLRRIIKSFRFETIKMEVLEKMNEEDLGRYLYESLQGHKYIVVIDDVWHTETWGSLKRAFPDDKNGSRVIITTRLMEVAKNSDERTYAHELLYLTPEKSWQLFCEKVFWKFDVEEGLEKLGREMVQLCNGLPLAIIALGGLLSTKTPQEWHVVHNQLWRHLKADSFIGYLFNLNYYSLPFQLKPCFLYLSCFPKDIEINIEKFINLLVAEDFIPKVKDRAMEEVAKDYLDELLHRNLIHVGQKYWGKILTYRVHDMLRDLATELAKNNFLVIYDEDKHSINISSTKSSRPRQVIYSGTENSSWLQECNPRMRSFFFYGEYQFSVPMCKRFSYLRVLVDGSIGNDYVTRKLIHLKYLGLKDSFIFLLPSIVFNLPRLQTLAVPRSVFPVDLPAEICKSQELRHLIGNFSCVPSSIESLTNLQTLRSITNRAWTEIQKTEKLANLRELWVGGPLKGSQVFLFDSMANLTSLRILSVELGHDDSFESLQPLSNCHYLVELRLRGKMESLPEDIHEVLPNLECLSLRDSRLRDDPMPLLEKLPKLTILHLGNRFYSRKKIMCSANGFPQLEILLFDEHKFQIEEWQVEEGALLRLKGLRIPENFKVKIPERLRSLPTPDPREYTTNPPDDADQYQV